MGIHDFAKMTTDDLLQIIPPTETNEWEFKAADIFDMANFRTFKSQKLGSIVSSFANSGGGFLLLGKRNGVTIFDPVPTHEGRTSMEDHLSLVISQCVVPHYRNFSIHRVPIAGQPSDSVLVVAFRDSASAPHQSVADTIYFYRVPGHCQRAPHFHLELLRNRSTKAVVEIEDVKFAVNVPLHLNIAEVKNLARQMLKIIVSATLTLRNVSHQIASPCALRVFAEKGDSENWTINGTPSQQGTLIEIAPTHLYPTMPAAVTVACETWIDTGDCSQDAGEGVRISFGDLTPEYDLQLAEVLPLWKSLVFRAQTLTQDFAGEPLRYCPAEILADAGEKMIQNKIDQRKRDMDEWKAKQGDRQEKGRRAAESIASLDLSAIVRNLGKS